MKLPIPFLLYTVSIGLFGLSGWTVYKMLPAWKKDARTQAHQKGYNDGLDRLGTGRGQGPVSADWDFGASTMGWWKTLSDVNLIGKLPPPPPDPKVAPKVEEPTYAVTPLGDLIELVSLVHDGQGGGTAGNSQVVIRYKQEANVAPPEWWMLENAPPSTSGSALPTAPVRDTVVTANRGGAARPQPARPVAPGARPTTPAPTSMTGVPILQKLWVADGGDPRRSAELWPMKPSSTDGKPIAMPKVRLVRVAPDAQAAFFVREGAPPKDGEAAAPPNEEELVKPAANLSQDVLLEMRRMNEFAALRKAKNPDAPEKSSTWLDVQETTRVDNVWHIGREDQKRMREAGDDFFDGVHVGTYSSSSGKTRGVVVLSVDPKLASKFGIGQGEVLLEINGKTVQSRGQAIQTARKDYDRGVRTFATKWLVNGAVVERTIQAPDK